MVSGRNERKREQSSEPRERAEKKSYSERVSKGKKMCIKGPLGEADKY